MKLRFHTLDVFTCETFAGNPLAVVMDADGLDGGTMQAIAREFKLSETVFVIKPADPAHRAGIRIFTPVQELLFAGHPTVGTALLLADLDGTASPMVLEEKIGPIRISFSGTGRERIATFEAATMPKPLGDVPPDDAIAAALGVDTQQIGYLNHRPHAANPGNHPMLYVPLASREALANSSPQMAYWQGLGELGKFLVYAYCAGSGENLFHARGFAPLDGIGEDPATGSAACGFPSSVINAEGAWRGDREIMIFQGEDMGRPSRINVTAAMEDGALVSVRIGGQAVRVSQGQLLLGS
ncbi:MAG: PhzF family phenazine biosynthesis protein [Nitratireductor sp.]|nr:PhzF family phenazine biosynthesis protein [Nitratireductor sp.]MCC0020604.1 PhzF family phenazine biosynthesis protein [Nitratireductor sp.]